MFRSVDCSEVVSWNLSFDSWAVQPRYFKRRNSRSPAPRMSLHSGVFQASISAGVNFKHFGYPWNVLPPLWVWWGTAAQFLRVVPSVMVLQDFWLFFFFAGMLMDHLHGSSVARLWHSPCSQRICSWVSSIWSKFPPSRHNSEHWFGFQATSPGRIDTHRTLYSPASTGSLFCPHSNLLCTQNFLRLLSSGISIRRTSRLQGNGEMWEMDWEQIPRDDC